MNYTRAMEIRRTIKELVLVMSIKAIARLSGESRNEDGKLSWFSYPKGLYVS